MTIAKHMQNIEKNLNQIRAHIAQAAQRYERDQDSVLLLAVAKRKPVADIRNAYEFGQRDFGENFLQEAQQKIQELADLEPGGETSLAPIFHDIAERIHRRSLIVVISDLFDDEDQLIDALHHFRYRKHDVDQLIFVRFCRSCRNSSREARHRWRRFFTTSPSGSTAAVWWW